MSTLTTPEQGHRIDHQGYTPEIWIGLFITAVYLLQTEPLIVTIGDTLEVALDALLAGDSFGSVCEALTATEGDRAALQAATWLKGWLVEGLLEQV